jgi:hypothetical protein
MTAHIRRPKTPIGARHVLKKNETRKALVAAVRVYVKAYLINNAAVTDEDKVAMGLPVYSHTRHPWRALRSGFYFA